VIVSLWNVCSSIVRGAVVRMSSCRLQRPASGGDFRAGVICGVGEPRRIANREGALEPEG
jgi:hypothetical protein